MKSAVVYLLLATAFLIFLAFSPAPNVRNGQLRLGRCLGCKHAPFDPLVEKIERLMKEEGWRNNDLKLEHFDSPAFDWYSNTFSGVLEDPEEYFTEEGQLNITGRLQILFPWLDRSPQDGMITLEELEAWNVRQATDRLVYQTQKKIMEHDKNGDKSISLAEYLPHISDLSNIGDTHSLEIGGISPSPSMFPTRLSTTPESVCDIQALFVQLPDDTSILCNFLVYPDFYKHSCSNPCSNKRPIHSNRRRQ